MTTPVVTVVDPTYVATAVSTAVGNAPKHMEAVFGATGTLSTLTGSQPYVPAVAATLFGVQVTGGSALGTGQALIVDIRRNGTSIFSNTANRPTLNVGLLTSFTPATNASTTSFSASDRITMDIVQVGTGASGITVQVYLTPLV